MARTARIYIEAPEVYDDGCLRVEHNKFYVACAGKPIADIRRKEFLILSRLVREIGRPVPLYDLWAAAWGGDGEFDHAAANALRAHVCYLRRRLEPLGVHIQTRQGIGYMLTYKLSSARKRKPWLVILHRF